MPLPNSQRVAATSPPGSVSNTGSSVSLKESPAPTRMGAGVSFYFMFAGLYALPVPYNPPSGTMIHFCSLSDQDRRLSCCRAVFPIIASLPAAEAEASGCTISGSSGGSPRRPVTGWEPKRRQAGSPGSSLAVRVMPAACAASLSVRTLSGPVVSLGAVFLRRPGAFPVFRRDWLRTGDQMPVRTAT